MRREPSAYRGWVLLLAAGGGCLPPPNDSRPSADVIDAATNFGDEAENGVVSRPDRTVSSADAVEPPDADLHDASGGPGTDAGDAAPARLCESGWGTCGGAGECASDLLNDDAHCGGCDQGCAPETRCVDGACAVVGVRLLAPISTHRVLSGRPWLRWEQPPDADLARVEVCDTPSCARVTHRWEVGGSSLRPPVALPVGVHFWRVSAGRGGMFGATTARPWEFEVRDAVPADEGNSRPPRFDLDGDGVVDRVEIYSPPVDFMRPAGSWTDPWRITVSRSTARSAEPDVTLVGYASWRRFEGRLYGEEHQVSGALALGDVNGDGYGDLGIIDSYLNAGHWGASSMWTTLYVYLGAPAGRPLQRVHVYLGNLSLADARVLVTAVGDRDGDGYGDLAGYISPQYSGSFTVFGARRRSLPLERFPYNHPGSFIVRGDFDADGREDLGISFTGNGMYGWSIGVYPGAPTRSIRNEVGPMPCVELDLVETWFWEGVRVVDHDDDGYDDLRVSNPARGSSVVLRGSATGLARPECIVVSRPL